MSNPVVFLDRDGTIARDVHYCSRVEDFKLLPTVPEAIRLLNENGFKVVVITNQSGIARGYFTEETLGQIHRKMMEELARHSALVDAIYYCPHHPDDSCTCRKPGTALFQRAVGEHDLDLSRSYMVGDTQMDIDAGKAIGCGTVLVTGTQESMVFLTPPDQLASNLIEAVRWILR